MTDNEMPALAMAAAMTAVMIEPEKRSPMTISFWLEYVTCNKIPNNVDCPFVSLAECIAVWIAGKR